MGNVRRAQSPARKLAAKTVREARAALGWSRERAEHESGISARTIGSMERGEVPMRALELVIELRAAAASQAPGASLAGAHCTALPGPLVAETAKAAPLGGDEASPQGLLGRAANISKDAAASTGQPPDEGTRPQLLTAGERTRRRQPAASPVSPGVETAAAAAALAPSGSKKAA